MKTSRYAYLVAGTLSLPASRPALAQTNFFVGDSTVRFATYTTAEECVALAHRLIGQYAVRQDMSRYSVSHREFPQFQPYPPIVADWSRKCMAKFRADTVPVERRSADSIALRNSPTLRWETGYLFARDFESAKRVRDREVAAIPDAMVPLAMRVRKALYADVVRPLDLDLLDELDSVAVEKLSGRGRHLGAFFERSGIWMDQIERRWRYQQRALAKSKAREFLAYLKDFNLTASERAKLSPLQTYGLIYARYSATRKLEHEHLLDSLRLGGPDAYERVLARMWKDAGALPEILMPVVGRPAKPVAVSFAFPRDSGRVVAYVPATNADSSIPSATKVTLLLFLNNACRRESGFKYPAERDLDGGECWEEYGMIRRLAQRFPSLDITVVTQTLGVIGSQLTNDPAEEAALIRSLWHGHHKLPVNIAIAYTPYYRLASPDHRRVDRPLDHVGYYYGRDFFPVFPARLGGNGFIIVPGRKVLQYTSFERKDETELQELFAPLMEWYDQRYVPAASGQGR